MFPFNLLNLTVGPGIVRFGDPVLPFVGLADPVEAHLARPDHVANEGIFGELDTVFSASRVKAVRHSFQHMFEEL